MTERKPRGIQWESWIDRQIREARERGEFDDLRGKGKPLPGLDEPHDPEWWAKQLLQREGVTPPLPPTLRIRKELEDARAAIAAASSEDEVRVIVTAINARIREVNRMPSEGPPSTVMPLDVDDVVRQWRQRV